MVTKKKTVRKSAKKSPKRKLANQKVVRRGVSAQRKFGNAARRAKNAELKRIRQNPKTTAIGEVGLTEHPLFAYVDQFLATRQNHGSDTFHQIIGMTEQYMRDHMNTPELLKTAKRLIKLLDTDADRMLSQYAAPVPAEIVQEHDEFLSTKAAEESADENVRQIADDENVGE